MARRKSAGRKPYEESLRSDITRLVNYPSRSPCNKVTFTPTVESASKQVTDLLKRCWNGSKKDDKVEIYLFPMSEGVGVRVLEVSFIRKHPQGGVSGSTFEWNSYPEGAAVCLAAERSILARMTTAFHGDILDIDRQLIYSTLANDGLLRYRLLRKS